MERFRRVVVKNYTTIGTKDKLLPIFVKQFVCLVNVKQVPFTSPNLLRLVKGNKLNKVTVNVVLVAGLVVELLPVQVVVPENIKEVPHNRSTKRRERLTANGYRFIRIAFGVIENKPEQDIIRFPTPCTALLNDNTLIAFD
jgi:hypothetical protein